MSDIHEILAAAYQLGDPTIEVSTKELNDLLHSYYAEESVMDDTLDMVGAPKCGDPFMSPRRYARVQMLAQQRDSEQERNKELETLLEKAYAQNADYETAEVLMIRKSDYKRLKAYETALSEICKLITVEDAHLGTAYHIARIALGGDA
jgi:hypothetical protein